MKNCGKTYRIIEKLAIAKRPRDAINETVAEFIDIMDKDILYSMLHDGEDVIGCSAYS